MATVEDDLIIEVDDELLAALTRLAAKEGCDVGDLAGRLIAEAVRGQRG